MDQAKPCRIYAYTSQPALWIVQDDDGYWLVPARPGGWQERSPFIGRVSGLQELPKARLADLGLPDS